MLFNYDLPDGNKVDIRQITKAKIKEQIKLEGEIMGFRVGWDARKDNDSCHGGCLWRMLGHANPLR